MKMKAFKQHWRTEIQPYIHNPADYELGQYWWKAALQRVKKCIDCYGSDGNNIREVVDFIDEELENEQD